MKHQILFSELLFMPKVLIGQVVHHFSSIKIFILALNLFLFATETAMSQPVFQNPSFEGVPMNGVAPPDWAICSGTPDVQPGFWGTTQIPSDGNSFLGFHHEESVSANFTNGIGSCSQMTFEMDVSIVPLNLPGNQYWINNNQGVK